MRILSLIIISILVSCNHTSKKLEEKKTDSKEIKIENIPTTNSENISYFEFKPDTLSKYELTDFDVESAYQFNSKRIVTAYDQKANPDTEKNWGDKLLLLNSKNEILFKSDGVGDVYLFEPHFYKNVNNEKIIIVCQLAYEYFFGGEAFIYSNGQIKYIGNIDIESENEERNLINILKINERENRIIFTFNADSIIYKPSKEAIVLKNNNIKYVYENEKLRINNIQGVDENQVETKILEIKAKGKIEPISHEEMTEQINLETTVIEQLKLNSDKIEFFRQKKLANNENETIIVIAENENDRSEDEEVFLELTSHILIVDSQTAEIKNHFSETSKENAWISDAIFIDDIILDTIVYNLAKDKVAFGIKLIFRGSSQVNPYGYTCLSLYIKEGNTLKKLLSNFDLEKYSGEINVNLNTCDGILQKEKNELTLIASSTNGYNDILVKNTTVNFIFETNSKGNCREVEKSRIEKTSVLKYNTIEYQ